MKDVRLPRLTLRPVVVLCLWALLISMAGGRWGISHYMELVEHRRLLQEAVAGLRYENARLETHLEQLRASPRARLRALKNDTGALSPGETLLLLGPALHVPEAIRTRPLSASDS